MILAAIDKEMYTPAATVISAIIAAVVVVWKTIYEKQRKAATETHIPKQAPRTKRMRISFEMVLPILLLLFSTWQLWVVLSDTSPVTRSTVLGISVFIGVGFLCIVFLLIKLMVWLALRKFKKENPSGGNVWL